MKQCAVLSVKLTTSTINDRVHAVASKLQSLYEALWQDIFDSDYLQIDEVSWRIADALGKSHKGYAWQVHDSRLLLVDRELRHRWHQATDMVRLCIDGTS